MKDAKEGSVLAVRPGRIVNALNECGDAEDDVDEVRMHMIHHNEKFMHLAPFHSHHQLKATVRNANDESEDYWICHVVKSYEKLTRRAVVCGVPLKKDDEYIMVQWMESVGQSETRKLFQNWPSHLFTFLPSYFLCAKVGGISRTKTYQLHVCGSRVQLSP